jgi:anti-anti-sigma factor
MASESLLSFEQIDGVTVGRLQATEITSGLDEILQVKLSEVCDADQPVKFILDLSDMTYLCTTGLGTLVMFLKRVKNCNGQLALAGLKGHCRNVLRVTRLEDVFDLCDDVPEALEKIRGAA